MKIRILGDSLRLRLSQTEVQLLASSGKVKESIRFGSATSQHLNYILQKAAISEIAAAYNGNNISVLIPIGLADDWVISNQISLEKYLPISGNEKLKILIEKDFKCLKERPGEDESDLFPNPEEGLSHC